MSDEQLQMLIFEPGFSTQEEISDLSGRGVGMDVVKRNVQQMNGTVGLVSEKGRGSTVTIELPLTLAILEGLLVRVGDRTLVLPLLSVIETVPLRDEQIVRVAEQGEVVVIREESDSAAALVQISWADARNGDGRLARRTAIAGWRSLWRPGGARLGWWSMNFLGSSRWWSRAWSGICAGLTA